MLSVSLVLVWLASCLAYITIVYGLASNSNNVIISNPKILGPNPDLINGNGNINDLQVSMTSAAEHLEDKTDDTNKQKMKICHKAFEKTRLK